MPRQNMQYLKIRKEKGGMVPAPLPSGFIQELFFLLFVLFLFLRMGTRILKTD